MSESKYEAWTKPDGHLAVRTPDVLFYTIYAEEAPAFLSDLAAGSSPARLYPTVLTPEECSDVLAQLNDSARQYVGDAGPAAYYALAARMEAIEKHLGLGA